MSRYRRGRRALALVVAVLAMLVGVLAGAPREARAATVSKDGFEAVGPYDIFVDRSKVTASNAVYSLPSDWHVRHVTEWGYGAERFYVRMEDPSYGKAQSWSTMTMRFPGAASDPYGNSLDLVMTMSPSVRLGSYNPSMIPDQHQTLDISVMLLYDDVGLLCYDTCLIDPAADEALTPGMAIQTTVRFVKAGTDTLASGHYAMYFEDIDQPDSTDGYRYDGTYAEGVELVRGMSKDVHARADTTVVADGDVIRGTVETNDNDAQRSAFATLCGPEYAFTWRASNAGTNLFEEIEFPSGELTVRKRVSSTAAEAPPALPFQVTFEGEHAPDPVEFTLADGQSFTIRGIPAGVRATVTELVHDEYAQSWAPASAVTITDGGSHVVTCTNTRRTGGVRVRKVATGTGIPASERWPFKVTVYDGLGRTWRTETFELANGGELIGPNAGAFIENESQIPVHASSLRVDPEAGWNFVPAFEEGDYPTKKAEEPELYDKPNVAAVQLVPIDYGTPKEAEDLYDYVGGKTTIGHLKNWSMSSDDGVTGSGEDTVNFETGGTVGNLASDISTRQKIAEIHWYVSGGDSQNYHTPRPGGVAIASVSNLTQQFADMGSRSYGDAELMFVGSDAIVFVPVDCGIQAGHRVQVILSDGSSVSGVVGGFLSDDVELYGGDGRTVTLKASDAGLSDGTTFVPVVFYGEWEGEDAIGADGHPVSVLDLMGHPGATVTAINDLGEAPYLEP